MRKMILVLTAVMILSGLILAATYSGLSPRIDKNREIALNKSLASLFTGTAKPGFEQLPDMEIVIYRGSLPDGQLMGYAVQVETQGYGGAMTFLVGLSADRSTIEGVEIVEQLETPGLGGRISDESFKVQFQGLDASSVISYVKNVEPAKDRNEIQAISGATITSKAIVKAINTQLPEAVSIIKELTQ